MPNFDSTGPRGTGKPGRGLGPCSKKDIKRDNLDQEDSSFVERCRGFGRRRNGR